jgi:hypothetical protein
MEKPELDYTSPHRGSAGEVGPVEELDVARPGVIGADGADRIVEDETG